MSTKLIQDNKFTIESITIESFRAYNKPHSFTFKEPVTIFCGPNGYGKSSTLYAIEWCLFGKVEFLSSLEGRSRDEIINQFNLEGIASVKIFLKNVNEEVKLERTKDTGKVGTNFTIKTKEGKFEDEEAESQFFKISGMTLDDFIRSVYLHQEAIRALLTDNKDERDAALDRLFGLEKIRNIIKGIPIKDVKDKIKDLDKKKDSLNQKISGAIQICHSDINKLKKKTPDYNLSERDLNLDFAIQNARSIIKEINTISKDYSVPKTEIKQPTTMADFSSFESKIKKAIKELQQKSFDHNQISELNEKKMKLDGLINSVWKQEKPIEELQNEVDDIISEAGNMEQIENKISALQTELEKENRKRDSLDIDSKLINDAIESLKTRTKSTCPICDNPIDIQKTISKLEKQSQKLITNQITEIDKKISELKAQKPNLESLQSDLIIYIDKLKNEKDIQNETLSELAAELETGETDKTKLFSVAKEKIQSLDSEIEKLEKSAREHTERFQRVRDSLDAIGLVMNILNKETELGNLRNLNPEDSQQIDSIGKAIVGLQNFEDKLTKIVNAAGKVQTELASEMISDSQKDVESYYTKLCMHQHYDKLKIDVKPQEIMGRVKNAYAIKAFSAKDGKETHVATRFSTGQMNCVALSVFFALTKALPLKLGFLILDDPSQNLDNEHKTALADILAAISKERQVFISTQDEEFKEILQSKQKNIRLHEFVGWDVSGPKFN